jgi:hypothetical protein
MASAISSGAAKISGSRWKELRFTGLDQPLALPRHIALGNNSLDVKKEWPDMQEFARAVAAWHDACSALDRAWGRTSESERLGLAEPPKH